MKDEKKPQQKTFLRSSAVAIGAIIAAVFLLNAGIGLILYWMGEDIYINLALGGAGHVIGMASVSGFFAILIERPVLRPQKEPSIMGMLGRYVLHYLLVFVVVQLYWWLAMGLYARNWTELSWLLGGFTGVYLISYGIEYLVDWQTARRINKRIQAQRKQTQS